MKWLNLILSIYIITLSGMPCADGAMKSSSSAASFHAQSDSGSHHDDACSPFCVCNCCQTAGFVKTVTVASADASVPQSMEKKQPRYVSAFFSNFHNTIWQPPKIS